MSNAHSKALNSIWDKNPQYGIFPNESRVHVDNWIVMMNDTSQETKDRFAAINELVLADNPDAIVYLYYAWTLEAGFIEYDTPDPFEDLTEVMN